ncbi:MAG: NUDIX domain-containing protein [Opitutales bacterium]
MRNSTGFEYIEISQALIRQENHFLMQLRDFKPDIESPGQWGFFAGHHEQGENAEEAMWRELEEELRWQPKKLLFLDTFLFGNRRIHVFRCDLSGDQEKLSLQEGLEFGLFSPKEIRSGQLYSRKKSRHYPITTIAMEVFRSVYGDLKDLDPNKPLPIH